MDIVSHSCIEILSFEFLARESMYEQVEITNLNKFWHFEYLIFKIYFHTLIPMR